MIWPPRKDVNITVIFQPPPRWLVWTCVLLLVGMLVGIGMLAVETISIAAAAAGVVPLRVVQPRPAHALLSDVAAGAESLHVLVSSWSPLMPKSAELTSAQVTVEGLAKLLRLLRVHLDGGPSDAE